MATNLISVLFLVLAVVSAVTAASLEPIWISPKNTTQLIKADILENFVADKGVWADLPGGIGARGGPSVHYDSKGIVWIVGGSPSDYSYLNAGWNYDPDADRYRWVAGQAQSSSNYKNTGVKGIEDPDVFPGYRSDVSTSVIDSKDQIWIYGENSLYRWNTSNGYFAFIGGDQSNTLADPIIGTPGEPSAEVWPGGSDTPCMVLDSQDNIWLIGGVYFPSFSNSPLSTNTVWHYNTTSGFWTFVYGNTNASTANNFAENIFGGRSQFACEIDENDRIWVFGGFQMDDAGNFFSLGDVWSFNTFNWTWTVIIEDTINSVPIIDIRNEFSPNNRPGSRYNHRMINRLDGSLMVYGGYQIDKSYYYDDLWIFNLTTYEWKIAFGAENLTFATQSKYTNYRTPGSVLGYRTFYGVARGKTNKGQFLLFGGVDDVTILKDMWIIPRDLCSLGLVTCLPEATCVFEDGWPNACKCPEGLVGDGKISCDIPPPVAPPVTPPVDPPLADVPTEITPVKTPTTQKTSDAARLIGLSIVAVTIFLL